MKLITAVTCLIVGTQALATTAQDVKNKTAEAAETTAAYTKEQKEAFMKDMDQQITTLKKQIAEMKSKAGKSKDQTVQDLEKKQKNLETQYTSLKNSSGRAWDKLKVGVSKAWDQLKTSVSEAKEEMKK